MKFNKFVTGFILSSAILVGNISPIYANTITSNNIDFTQYTIEEKEQLLKEDISNFKELITSTEYSLKQQLKMSRLSYSGERYTATFLEGLEVDGNKLVRQW